MSTSELPWWLLNTITFREGDDDDNSGDGEDGDEGDNSGDDGEEGEGEGEGGNTGGDSDDKDSEAAKLRKALKEERRLRRKAERDARKASKKTSDDKDEKDAEAARKEAEAAQQKVERLAVRLRTSSVDNALIEEARRQGFIDPTDVLLDAVRKEVDVDQDDEDPSDIDIDDDSVKDAVKAYAQKKPHLLGSNEEGSGTPSGGKFRKKGNKGEKTSEEVLRSQYPSLQ